MKHFVIGDVHGNFDALMRLFYKLPNEIEPIFVGDLIDRGDKSKEIVAFVRENNYLCVRGNHEAMMIESGKQIIKAIRENKAISFYDLWLQNGGLKTFLSYGLVEFVDGTWQKKLNVTKALKAFEKDIEWMESLPLYLELPLEINNLPVVVSHAQVASVWEYKDIGILRKIFEDRALWNRKEVPKESAIFNIFGHTPQANGVMRGANFVNVDRGCYKKEEGFGKLSAFCIETQEVVEVCCK